MKNIIIRLLFIGSTIYILLCASLYLFQDNLLYFPSSNAKLAATLSSDKNIQTFEIPVSAGKIVGRAAWNGSCLMVYFGGNAENTDLLFSGQKAWYEWCIFAAMNYRGYGASEWSPRETNMHQDAVVWFDSVVSFYHPTKIIVMGRSLGTNVALFIAHERAVNKLILVTPYDSIANVARFHYPFVPVSFLIHDGFDSSKITPDIRIPTLILAAGKDSIVPRANTEALIWAFWNNHPLVVSILWADHNSIIQYKQYEDSIQKFIRQ